VKEEGDELSAAEASFASGVAVVSSAAEASMRTRRRATSAWGRRKVAWRLWTRRSRGVTPVEPAEQRRDSGRLAGGSPVEMW
jgi:hypothetical protein